MRRLGWPDRSICSAGGCSTGFQAGQAGSIPSTSAINAQLRAYFRLVRPERVVLRDGARTQVTGEPAIGHHVRRSRCDRAIAPAAGCALATTTITQSARATGGGEADDRHPRFTRDSCISRFVDVSSVGCIRFSGDRGSCKAEGRARDASEVGTRKGARRLRARRTGRTRTRRATHGRETSTIGRPAGGSGSDSSSHLRRA